jgi:polygalacturonase
MPVARREFLKSGIAVAAAAVTAGGCNSLSVRAPAQASGGWYQVPEILSRIVPPDFPSHDFLVTGFGAVGDGRTDCFAAFAAAITACNKAGGGRVVVPGASHPYLVNGPIHLLSNVNLYLEPDSEILFGTIPEDYLPVVLIRYQGIRCYNYSPLVYANGQTNIAITGSGTLNGQALQWAAWELLANPDWAILQKMVTDGLPVEKRVFGSGHHLRLTMFEPYDCTNILVEGVTFKASPFWTLHPVFCTNLTFRNVTILPGTSNDDGCDPDSCTDVLVTDCTFSTSDDNISLKAGFGADAAGLPACQNVVIQNCNAISSLWGGFTLGSNTTGSIKSVFIENCITRKCLNAFYIKSNREEGGTVENIFIRSSQALDCERFFYLQTNYAAVYSGPTPATFNNIVLENMSCSQVAGTAFVIAGDVENPAVYLTFQDIAIANAAAAQQVSNALFVNSSNVTVNGQPVTINGLL